MRKPQCASVSDRRSTRLRSFPDRVKRQGRAALIGLGIVLGASLSGTRYGLAAQTSDSTTAAVSAVGGVSTSDLLKPALDTVQQTVGTLRVDKWKCSPAVRDETEANLNSIRNDLATTLPPLLATADGAPASLVSVLPAFRNVDALYDVLLRITETSQICGPRQQSDALQQAMTGLESSRRTLGDRMQASAAAQEQKLADAQAALRARPVIPAAPAPVEPPRTVPPAAHPAKPRKPKPKPITPAPTPSATPAPTAQ